MKHACNCGHLLALTFTQWYMRTDLQLALFMQSPLCTTYSAPNTLYLSFTKQCLARGA